RPAASRASPHGAPELLRLDHHPVAAEARIERTVGHVAHNRGLSAAQEEPTRDDSAVGLDDDVEHLAVEAVGELRYDAPAVAEARVQRAVGLKTSQREVESGAIGGGRHTGDDEHAVGRERGPERLAAVPRRERRPRDTARPERRIEHTVGRVARRDELAVPGSEIGRRGPGYQLAVGLLGETDDYRL